MKLYDVMDIDVIYRSGKVVAPIAHPNNPLIIGYH